MTEEAKKPAKAKVGKAPVAKEARHPEPKQSAGEGSRAVAKDSSGAKRPQNDGKKIKLTQLTGTIARQSDQRATLIGLRLNKRHRVSVLQDTPEIRGMIYKVRHLVKVENA